MTDHNALQKGVGQSEITFGLDARRFFAVNPESNFVRQWGPLEH